MVVDLWPMGLAHQSDSCVTKWEHNGCATRCYSMAKLTDWSVGQLIEPGLQQHIRSATISSTVVQQVRFSVAPCNSDLRSDPCAPLQTYLLNGFQVLLHKLCLCSFANDTLACLLQLLLGVGSCWEVGGAAQPPQSQQVAV